MKAQLVFRYAERKDAGLILQFIKELAEYERMEDEVTATKESIEEWIFDKEKAEALLAEINGKAVGFALFFSNFPAYLGKAGIYLEDLYVRQEYRGCGYGKAIFGQLAKIAVERGYRSLAWMCLDWNQPSIDFYLSMGARPVDECTVYRMTGETLERIASEVDENL